MANDYYKAQASNLPLTRIRSSGENSARKTVEVAFDKLPVSDELFREEYAFDISTVNTQYLLTTPSGSGALIDGQHLTFKPTFTCAAGVDVKVNSSAVRPVEDSLGVLATEGLIVAGIYVDIIFVEAIARWQVLTTPTTAADALVISNLATVSTTTLASAVRRTNFAINGKFDIWQRGITVTDQTGANIYATADRWRTGRTSTAAGLTASQSTNNPGGSKFALKLQRVVSNISTADLFAEQQIESAIVEQLQGETVQVEYDIYLGANFSADRYVTAIRTGTVADESVAIGASFTGNVRLFLQPIATPLEQWIHVTLVGVTVPSDAKALMLEFSCTPKGTAGADDSFEIANVTLTKGAPNGLGLRTVAEELKLCQRYYEKSYTLNTNPGTVSTPAQEIARSASISTAITSLDPQMVEKRTTPSIILYSPDSGSTGVVYDATGDADRTAVVVNAGTGKFSIHLSAVLATTPLLSAQWTADAEL